MLSFITKRSFSTTANPRVVIGISKAGAPVGNLEFELYADRQPNTTENFVNLCADGLKGTHFHRGLPGFGISGGKMGDEDVSSHGVRLPDESLEIRHSKRGLLTTSTHGMNAVGS